MSRALASVAVTLLALALGAGSAAAAGPAGSVQRPVPAMPEIEHVFIIVLENENAEVTFGPDSPAPYLAKTLPSMGNFLPNYYATGHLSLDNYITMISGQAPNPQTQADCIFYNDFLPGTPTADGQVSGSGCVYPGPEVQTIANQLEKSGLTWKGYMEDMAAKAPEEPASCRHPAVNSMDDTQSAEVGDEYATRHNPFVYFHSIIDYPTCEANDVDFSEMADDLKSVETTANYSFISPNLCNDGHDEPCVDGSPGGLEQVNEWLSENVPPILNSPAYKRHGLLMVTFDEAEAFGGEADSSACCGEQPGPNTPSPGGPTPGPGGGRIGAVMLSPCIRGGTTSEQDYNHYSMLASIEDNFGLGRLGYAAQADLPTFGTDVLNRADCREKMKVRAKPRKVEAGTRQTFRLKVRSHYARCRQGVIVKLVDRGEQRRPRGAKRRAVTGRNGRAKIRTFVRKPGKLVAHAYKRDCIPGKSKVRVR